MSNTSKLIVSVLVIIVVVIAFGAGYTFGHRVTGTSDTGPDIVEQAWDIILDEYVDRDNIDTENMTRAAIVGMLDTLNDPYTSFLAAEDYQIGVSSLEGEFEGIGAYVTVHDKQLTIIAPIADSPADKSGIRAGDVIMEIDGEPVADMTLAEAIIKIRGPRGTTVTLLVLHEGDAEPVEIEIVRTTVEVPSVRTAMEGDIAHIAITQFSERTGEEMTEALDELDSTTRGIVLDLRGNPGGLLDTVIDVASHFISEGTIVEVKSNEGKIATLSVDKGIETTDLPVVVLVDSASASGSEVLAGALQDHDRAVVAGNVTYGKGSVNVLHRLDDGSGIYITTARWLTPDGRLIEGQGIEPDIRLEVTGEDALRWAVGYLTDNG